MAAAKRSSSIDVEREEEEEKQKLPAERYAYDAEADIDDHSNGVFENLIKILSIFLIIITLPFSLCACIRIVQVITRAPFKPDSPTGV